MITLKTHSEIPLQLEITGADSLQSLLCGGTPWCAFSPEVEVRDELRGQIYHLNDAKCSPTPSGELVYSWPEAEFVLRERWDANDDALTRLFTVSLTPGAAKRSFSLMELLPYPENVYGWTAWTAYEKFPKEMEWIGGNKVYYGDLCYGTVLPCMSFYNEPQDRGILCGVPQGMLPGGRLSFAFRDYHSEGIEIEFSDLLLTDQNPVICPLLLAGQKGDYRCTLAFWKKRFPEYFARAVSRPQEDLGPFLMTHPELADESLERMSKLYAPAWAEIHNHFSKYGEYAPDGTSWESILKHDYPEDWTGRPMSVEKINRHIAELHKHHILAMLYLQCSGDCYIPYAEAQFPQDIARDAAGRIMPTWKECCFVSAQPGTAFHDHIIRQIDRFLDRYPNLDGVFLDQLCYQAIDFAHQDGKTAHRNREASRFGDSYTDTLTYLCQKLHEKGRTLWANGPYNIDAAKDVDGIMSEGSGTLAKTTQYMTIGEKSLLVASYATSAEDVEQMFRHCLLCGGNYSVSGAFSVTTIKDYNERIKFLLNKCGALTKLLAGCQWELIPHPYRLPEEMEGNLFRLPDQSLALTIVSKHDTLVHGNGAVIPEFTAEVRSTKKICSVRQFSINGEYTLAWQQDNDIVKLKVTGHNVFSVIIFREMEI